MTETPKSIIPVGKYFTTKDGYQLHYHEAGTLDSGKPSVMMLHGSGPGASGYGNFRGNFPFLAEHGYHVIIPDCLGYGLSSKPADFLYRADAQVELLRELLAHIGVPKVILVGNSLGGWFSLLHAINYPGEVAKLILMAPGGLEPPELFVDQMEGLKELFRIPIERDFSLSSMRHLFDLFTFAPNPLPDSALLERMEVAKEQPKEVYTTIGGTSATPRLGEIKAPILAFWGYHDKFVPYRHSKILLDNAPDVRLISSNAAGHWFMIEQPDLFNRECLEFLSS